MAAKRNSPRKERDIRRKVGVRPVKKSFLIVCEGGRLFCCSLST